MKTRLVQVCALWLFMFVSPLSVAKKPVTFTFGVVPQQTAVRMAKTWVPFTKYLKKKTGYSFRFATAKNISAFKEALDGGAYDFGYMNPYQYISNSGSGKYQAFAHARDKQIKGIIVTHKNGIVRSLKDIHNEKIAFPSKVAFGATTIVLADLKRHGIKTKPAYVSSHDSVFQNVAKGNFVAGAGVNRTFAAMPAKIRSQLQILHTTKGYTPHAIAAHARVPAQVVLKVQQALIEMEGDEDGRALLSKLKIKGVVTSADSEWDDVRHDFPVK